MLWLRLSSLTLFSRSLAPLFLYCSDARSLCVIFRVVFCSPIYSIFYCFLFWLSLFISFLSARSLLRSLWPISRSPGRRFSFAPLCEPHLPSRVNHSVGFQLFNRLWFVFLFAPSLSLYLGGSLFLLALSWMFSSQNKVKSDGIFCRVWHKSIYTYTSIHTRTCYIHSPAVYIHTRLCMVEEYQ